MTGRKEARGGKGSVDEGKEGERGVPVKEGGEERKRKRIIKVKQYIFDRNERIEIVILKARDRHRQADRQVQAKRKRKHMTQGGEKQNVVE